MNSDYVKIDPRSELQSTATQAIGNTVQPARPPGFGAQNREDRRAERKARGAFSTQNRRQLPGKPKMTEKDEKEAKTAIYWWYLTYFSGFVAQEVAEKAFWAAHGIGREDLKRYQSAVAAFRELANGQHTILSEPFVGEAGERAFQVALARIKAAQTHLEAIGLLRAP